MRCVSGTNGRSDQVKHGSWEKTQQIMEILLNERERE